MEFDLAKQDDKTYVMEMVQKQGSLLDYASDRLKADKEVVMAAIQQDGNALEFASDTLKDDKEVVLASIKKVGWTACYVSQRLSDDKETAAGVPAAVLYYHGSCCFRFGKINQTSLLFLLSPFTIFVY